MIEFITCMMTDFLIITCRGLTLIAPSLPLSHSYFSQPCTAMRRGWQPRLVFPPSRARRSSESERTETSWTARRAQSARPGLVPTMAFTETNAATSSTPVATSTSTPHLIRIQSSGTLAFQIQRTVIGSWTSRDSVPLPDLSVSSGSLTFQIQRTVIGS